MIEVVASEELSRILRRRGALILAGAGLIWVSVGTSGMTPSPSGRGLTATLSLAVTLVAALLAARAGVLPTPRRRLPANWLRRAGVINLGQLVAIVLAVVVLMLLHRSTFVPAALCLIVGLHFLPLARVFGQPQYRWTGALLCLAAVSGVAAYVGGAGVVVSRAVVGIGAAVILWGSSLHISLRNLSPSPARCAEPDPEPDRACEDRPAMAACGMAACGGVSRR